jgi:hypothetical protein
MSVSISEFDGFYFNPKGDEEIEFNYFKFNEEKDRGNKVGNNDMGDMYHIVLWSPDEIGLPEIRDNYEAILIDPIFYAESLTKSNNPSYGVIIRKTTESFKFVDSYLVKLEVSVEKAIETMQELATKKKKRWYKWW